jgi:acyl-homoserine-lactone acylase
MRHAPTSLIALTLAALSAAPALSQSPYPDRVEIRRTSYGVPHILAQDLGALGYGLAWVQLEDYGAKVVVNFMRSRGELARYFGRDSIESDFRFKWTYQQMQETYHLLHADTRELFEGFAAGVNRYVELHPDEFPDWRLPQFTGRDAAALWVDEEVFPAARRFLRAQARRRAEADSLRRLGAGSNAWAFAPSRTKSGRAILLRNPHLNWRSGYYEAQITVPGVINFYGDFRIGYPLYFNGGFNEHLGWATTNNNPDLEEVYALDVDPRHPDRVLFDGGSIPLERVPITVYWKNGPGLSSDTREYWETPLGPVVDRGEGKVYVLRSPGWGEYRKAEQFLRMMRASSLEEWKDAMRMQAHTESNHTYADRDGNVFYVWNAAIPRRPNDLSGADTAALDAAGTDDVWTVITPWDSLPQLLNPRGGYTQNANDPFHFTNLNEVIDSAAFPPYFSRPRLGLRSQHSLDLVHGREKVSLEDVLRLKMSYRMLAAERFKDDLLEIVRATVPTGDTAAAVAVLESWDNTVAPDSRGSILFGMWFLRFVAADSGDTRPSSERWLTLWAEPWSAADPVTTPDGIADVERAARIFGAVVEETKQLFGSLDVAWGEVHRVRLGELDLPVGGCSGFFGCFRVLWFDDQEDGKQAVAGGDGWVIAVEFGRDGPRAYSILAYGQSNRPDSPHHTDQTEMFVRGEFKRVAFTEEEIAADLQRRYRPGTAQEGR